MDFSFAKTSIDEVVSIAQEVVSTKNIGSVLSSILIKAEENSIFVKATDLKIYYEAQIPVKVLETGIAAIYCNKFIEILNSFSLTEEIEFLQKEYEEDENDNLLKTTIRSVEGKINFQVKNIPYKKFPDFYFEDDIPFFEIDSKKIKEMIAQTLFAVSIEEARYFMNGVFFEKKENNLNLVATDGRRLSFISKPILENAKDFPSVIVHPKILNIILKYAPNEGNIFIAIVEKKFFCKFSNYKFSAALLEGQFPNYTRVIPKKQSFIFYVKKTDLTNALDKRISLMLDKKTGRIFFDIAQGNLNISSSQDNVGTVKEEIPCKFVGNPVTIAFNFSYIGEPLKEISTETIAFEFTEEMKAVTMRPDPAQDYFHIIMPMQKE